MGSLTSSLIHPMWGTHALHFTVQRSKCCHLLILIGGCNCYMGCWGTYWILSTLCKLLAYIHTKFSDCHAGYTEYCQSYVNCCLHLVTVKTVTWTCQNEDQYGFCWFFYCKIMKNINFFLSNQKALSCKNKTLHDKCMHEIQQQEQKDK